MTKKKDISFFWFVACKPAGYEPITYTMMHSNSRVDDDEIMYYLKKNVCYEHRNVDFVDEIEELVFVAIDAREKEIVIEPLDPYEFWPLEELSEDAQIDKEFLEHILHFSFASIYGDEKGGEKEDNGTA